MLKWIQTVSAAAGKADFLVFLLVLDVKYWSEQQKNSLTVGKTAPHPETTAQRGEKREKNEKREQQRESAEKL